MRFDLKVTCLACGAENDCAGSLAGDDRAAVVGAFMLCLECAAVAVLVEVGPPAKIRPTTDEDNEAMAASDLNRVRQFLLDRIRFDAFTRQSNSDAETAKILAEIPEGKHPVLGGVLCSDGPPPRRWRGKAERARCRWCRQQVWVNRPLPGVPIACAGCLARLFVEEGKRLT